MEMYILKRKMQIRRAVTVFLWKVVKITINFFQCIFFSNFSWPPWPPEKKASFATEHLYKANNLNEFCYFSYFPIHHYTNQQVGHFQCQKSLVGLQVRSRMRISVCARWLITIRLTLDKLTVSIALPVSRKVEVFLCSWIRLKYIQVHDLSSFITKKRVKIRKTSIKVF